MHLIHKNISKSMQIRIILSGSDLFNRLLGAGVDVALAAGKSGEQSTEQPAHREAGLYGYRGASYKESRGNR